MFLHRRNRGAYAIRYADGDHPRFQALTTGTRSGRGPSPIWVLAGIRLSRRIVPTCRCPSRGVIANNGCSKPWHRNLPQPAASSPLADVPFGVAMVERLLYVRVDDGRCFPSAPNSSSESLVVPSAYGMMMQKID
jgi:hypothetical protein